MNVYEYTPEDRNLTEKLLACLALAFAAGAFGVSLVNGIPYPAIFQFVTVLFLAVAFVIANKSILRSYTYTVTEPDETGEREFLITEHYGKKHTAVCRVTLSQVEGVRIVKMREKTVIREAEKAAALIYRYLTPLFPREIMLVTLRTGDAVTLLRIPAEKGLAQALTKQNSNICL